MSTHDPYGSQRPGQPYPGNQQQAGQAYPSGYTGHGAPVYSGQQQQNQPYPGGYAQQDGPGYQGQQPGPYVGEQSGQGFPTYPGGQQQYYGGHQGGLQHYGNQPGVPVGFVEAIKRFYAKYAQFSGRASRSEYWWVALYTFIVLAPLLLLQSTAGTNAFGEMNGFGILLTLLMVVFVLGNLVPTVAITVRRLHDANLSGWLYLLNLIPYVGGIIMIVLTVLPSKPEGARFDR